MRSKALPFSSKEVKAILALFDRDNDWVVMTLPQLKYIVENDKLVKKIKES